MRASTKLSTRLLTGLGGGLLLLSLSACNLVSESLLVKNKTQLQKPSINPVPADMKGSYVVMTPDSMTNRFSYYGIEHAEHPPTD